MQKQKQKLDNEPVVRFTPPKKMPLPLFQNVKFLEYRPDGTAVFIDVDGGECDCTCFMPTLDEFREECAAHPCPFEEVGVKKSRRFNLTPDMSVPGVADIVSTNLRYVSYVIADQLGIRYYDKDDKIIEDDEGENTVETFENATMFWTEV